MLRDALEHCTLCRSIDRAEQYCVDAYAGTGQVNVKVAAELDHSGFSRRIPDLGRGCADVGEKGGCVDHRTAGRLGALCQSDVVVDNVEPAESIDDSLIHRLDLRLVHEVSR